MDKIVITVVGKDREGIIAAICTYLSNQKINILDISQTIVNGFFNMMLIADMQKSPKAFSDLCDELKSVGSEIGVVVQAQKEAIFDMMQRV